MARVLLQPHFIFGLQTEVNNNLCFVDEQTVLFPSGGSCVRFHTEQRSQRFIHGSEGSGGMHALSISPNRRFLAVCEQAKTSSITVVDLHHEQGRRRKVLTADEVLFQEFVCMAFSHDSKYLVGQTGSPGWMLIFWLWEKNKVLATIKTTISNNPVTQVSFRPSSNTQLCVSGNGIFKVFRYSEGVLKQTNMAKASSLNLLCHTWISEHRVAAGTDTGRLLVSESGELKREIRMSSKAGQHRQAEVKPIAEGAASLTESRISAIVSYSKGLVCTTAPGTVCLFERAEEDTYRKSREITIPGESQEIRTVCISPAEQTLAVSTNQGQLYCISMPAVLTEPQEKPLHFTSLLQPPHCSRITGLSVCVLKPLAATSSMDRSVRVWNYENRELEQKKQFEEEAHSVALHPTGLFILVGFSDQLRLMSLLFRDIRVIREFAVQSCMECVFSHGGHLFAAANGNVIHIYSFTSFEKTLNLKGHSGKVQRMEFNHDDSRLVSCGMDGDVYEWNTQSGRRESESVLKACSYTDVAFSYDFKSVLAVGPGVALREIQDCRVLGEVPPDDTPTLVLAVCRSGRVVFTGTASGTIRAIRYPLPSEREWITQQAHSSPVTKMVITYDEQFLLTASEDGCLLISKIVDAESQRLRQTDHLEEVLFTQEELEEKERAIVELQMRLDEVHLEREYQLRLKDISFKEKLKELSGTFAQEMEHLRTTEQTLRAAVEKSEREHQEASAAAALKHAREVGELETSYASKLAAEHSRYLQLLQRHQGLQEEQQEQLRAAEEQQRQALEELAWTQQAELQEQARLLDQSREEAEEMERTLTDRMKQMKEDEERKVGELRLTYEEQLSSERLARAELKEKSLETAQKLSTLQRRLQEKTALAGQQEKECDALLVLIRSLESGSEELKRQISALQKNSLDQDLVISDLKKKEQQLKKVSFVFEQELNDLKKKCEPQQDEIIQKSQKIQELKVDLTEKEKVAAQLKVSLSELTAKLKAKDKDVQKERQRVTELQTQLNRMKSDLHICAGFIQQPKELREQVQTLLRRHGNANQQRSSEDQDSRHQRHTDFLERTVSGLRQQLTQAAEEQQRAGVKFMKENMRLITEVNQLRQEVKLLRTQVRDYETRLNLSKSKSAE